ncbi:MAG: S9 family peptidase [Phycisphaerales bacterium]|nr:S9 family peptidase [Phycisphaerales bacterium]
MVTKRFRVFSLSVAAFLATAVSAQSPSQTKLAYPPTNKVDVVEDLHGVKIADPYRWLEDLDSKETAAWVTAQNEVTFSYLAAIPARNPIKNRMTKLWDYEKYGMPQEEGGRYFYSYNTGLQNQSVYYVTEKLADKGRVLIDPNTLSADGTVALGGSDITPDAKRIAYGFSTAGSDWVEIKVREIDTGKDLDDHIKWVKFGGPSWAKDGKGFFYSRFDEPKGDENALSKQNFYHKLFYHKLGTSQKDDILIYHAPDEARKDWSFSGGVTDDGKYLIIYVSQGTERKNRLYYMDLADGVKPYGESGAAVVKLLDEFDAQYGLIDNDGPVFFVRTDNNAPRARVIAIDTRKPSKENWKELIPQSADPLQGVSLLSDMFVCTYLHDAATQVKIFDITGKPVRDVELPGIGSAGGFAGKRKDTETFYSFTSFNYPPTIFRYDMKTGKSVEFRRPKVDFDPAAYEVKQVFYPSKDGTKIPMFITHKKGIKLDGTNPTHLYGYGGFNIPMTPNFSIGNVVWMEMGGVYAVPNLRGGGEYGEAWHKAGTKLQKQNVFDDFIAAAEWLIANKYTASPKLAISGGSNGGLLVGACMTQRPELFGACLPAVGVMDMLRFHKFTIGHAWKSDYGDPDKPDDFKVAHAYSPLHNIKPNTCYPATMITTGDHDDRVVPSHSFKFAAAIQAAQACDKPTLIRIETRAGHGAGKPTAKIIEEAADRWAFLVRALNVDAGPAMKAWEAAGGAH